MSRALDIADRMAARLTAADALSGVTCLVDRQKDIATEVAKSVAKASGSCLVITYEGFSNPDSNQSGKPRVVRRYTATIFSRPVLADGQLAADVLETAALILHNWEPDPATDGFAEIRVASGDYRPDSKFLLYDLDLEVTAPL